MQYSSKTAIGLILLGLTTPAQAQWEADPDLIERFSVRHPFANYVEAEVPDYDLPPLLTTVDGEPIESATAWESHREHLLELFREHMYGRSPGKPEQLTFDLFEQDDEALDGRATLKRILVRSAQGDEQHEFELTLFLPNSRTGPTPTFLLINRAPHGPLHEVPEEAHGGWPVEAVIERGYALAGFHREAVAPDSAEAFREGIIRLFEDTAEPRDGNAWGGLGAWGWAASRAMDYFETDAGVDEQRVALVGHSRGGKAALWRGAEDTRFAMVVGNNAGAGGAALSRRRVGETVLRLNYNYHYWFCENFQQYDDNEDALPVDQHMLLALIAPRVVYITSGSEDLWADPRGEFLALAHCSPVYRLYGHPGVDADEMPAVDTPLIAGPQVYHIQTDRHSLSLYDWQRFMDLADTRW